MLQNIVIEAELDVTVDYALVEKKKLEAALEFMMSKLSEADKKHLRDNMNFDITPLKFDV